MENSGVTRTALCMPKYVAVFYEKVQHTHAVLSFCPLHCLLGRWTRVARSLPELHCALRVIYALCFHTQSWLPYSFSVLVNWFVSHPEFVLPCPSVKKEICFPNPDISCFDVNLDILYPNPNNMHCFYNAKGQILILDLKCLIASD